MFRSRYLFAIGHRGVFSLGRWASRIRTRFHVSGLTQVPSDSPTLRLRDFHPLWSVIPDAFGSGSTALCLVLQPRRDIPHGLGTLEGGLGCSPLDDRAYPLPSSCRGLYTSIRSLVRTGRRVAPRSDSVALPPLPTTSTLTLKLFQGERAISTFDDTFNPPHRSSPSFSTLVSSGLHGALPPLHPAHA